jgi:PKD repeat protein
MPTNLAFLDRRFLVAVIGVIICLGGGRASGQQISKTGWALKFVDSQETICENAVGTNGFDGNPATIWHTFYCRGIAALPHEIQIDLGQNYDLTGLGYLPRQDGCSHGWIKDYKFYTSLDGTSWTQVLAGSFDYSGYTLGCPGASVPAERQATFPSTLARYVRLQALSEVSGDQWISMAELNLSGTLHTGNLPPNGIITSPGGNVTIGVGQSLSFTGSGSDPDGNTPLSYTWSFGAGSGVSDINGQNTGPVTFNNAGSFPVTLTVKDSLNLADPTPATITVTVVSQPVGSIAKSGWTLKYVDSQETICASNLGTNGFDDNPASIWHTVYCRGIPALPHELQIDLGGQYNLNGLGYLPRQDGCSNGWIRDYKFYVSLDGSNWTQVASGAFDYSGYALGCPGASVPTVRQASFPSVVGRYVRLQALSEVSGAQWISMAELYLTGSAFSGNLPPNGTITSPAGDVTIASGQSISFTGTGSDPDGDTNLSYTWSFGAGSGISDISTQNTGPVVFNNPGTYSVTLTVRDSQGLADPSPATLSVTVVDNAGGVILPGGWTLRYVDSQETVCSNDLGIKSFDANSSTFWHTKYCGGIAPLPHEIQIDLGQTYELTGLSYLPRQDGCSHGWIKGFSFSVSLDGTSWTQVALANFDYSGLSFGCPGASVPTARQITFAPALARYVRLQAVSEVQGYQWISMAELGLTGSPHSGNLPPSGFIVAPSGDVTISAGESVSFTGSGSDPDNNTPLTYRWSFGAGSGIPDMQTTTGTTGPVQFNVPGSYTVSLTVRDSQGLDDPSPATVAVTVISGQAVLVPQNQWRVQFVDSQEVTCADNRAFKSFDGDISTLWHTQYCGGVPNVPHEIQIDLGGKYNISGLLYVPRQDGCANGWVKGYELYVSSNGTNYDPLNWGASPLASGQFDYSGYSSGTATLQSCFGASAVPARAISIPATLGRYVRFRALSEVSGNPLTSAAELRVVQACSSTPSVLLNSPTSRELHVGSSLDVKATLCLGSGQTGWGVRYTLDGGSPIDVYSAPYQATFTGIGFGEHTIDAYLIDNTGTVQTGAGAHDQATYVGVGDYYVAMGDSITFGAGDDYAADNTSTDGRNTGGGFTPILNNLLTARKGRPQNVVNEGVGGVTSGYGVSVVNTVLARHPEAQQFLLLYGTNDSYNQWPSGLNLKPGDYGYNDSYKDHLQRMINAINAAGKKVAIAKVPPVLENCNGSCALFYNPNNTRNQIIQQYNQVIDQLAANPANQITIIGPDLYTYFSAHPNEFADPLHPNGVGYQSMANMWNQALP